MRRRTLVSILGVSVFLLTLVGYFLLAQVTPWHTAKVQHVTSPSTLPSVQLELVTERSAAPAPETSSIEPLWEQFEESAKQGNWTPWAVVADAETGAIIFESGMDTPHTPASTTKSLTAFAALLLLDPEETLDTGTSLLGDTLYLWGQGDLTLAANEGDPTANYGRAGIKDLAEATAEQLPGGTYKLAYQESLFGTEMRWKGWEEQGNTEFTGDIAPFAIDTGRTWPGAWDFVPDSARATAETLTWHLEELGVAISEVVPVASVPGEAKELAVVTSAPLLSQIQYMLEDSDNTMAEQFCHMAAVSNDVAQPTFPDSVANLKETLSAAGVDISGVELQDCSGLDEESRVPPRVLLETLQLSLENPDSAALTRMLPISGLTGTMAWRLEEGTPLGNYTAKTGSLGQASTLAGLGTTKSGANVYILVGSDDVPDNGAWETREAVDEFVQAVLDL